MTWLGLGYTFFIFLGVLWKSSPATNPGLDCQRQCDIPLKLSGGSWRSVISFRDLYVFLSYFFPQEAPFSGCGWGRSFRNLLYRNSLVWYFFCMYPYAWLQRL